MALDIFPCCIFFVTIVNFAGCMSSTGNANLAYQILFKKRHWTEQQLLETVSTNWLKRDWSPCYSSVKETDLSFWGGSWGKGIGRYPPECGQMCN